MQASLSLGLVALAACLVGPVAGAQTAPTQQLDVPYAHDTGWVVNSGTHADVIDSFTVQVPGSDWLRLYFDRADLPRGCELRITSWRDGDVQVLDAQTVRQWGLSSCYLNGDTLQVDLYAPAHAAPARLVLREVDAGVHTADFSICGATDDRVLSNDPRSARILPVGCTGWLIDDCAGCFLTAGHCSGGLSVVQFNVPLSTGGGGLVNPPAADQYPIDPASVQTNGGQGVGNDWAVFGAFANSGTGLTARQAQGGAFTLANSIPGTTGQTIRITGYGTDSSPPTSNQVQQTHVGPFVNNSGTQVGYVTDTTGGNSGSPVIHEQTGNAIGIHTHGGCNSTGGNNWGTQITLPALQAAINNPQGVCASACSGGCVTDAFAPNHSCAAAATLTNGSYGLEVCKTEPDFFTLVVAAGATVNLDVLHDATVADIDAMLYAFGNCSDDQGSGCGNTLACGFTSTDDENLSWTNTSGVDVTCLLRVHVWPNSNGDAGPYDLVASGIGATPCGAVADVFEPNDSCPQAMPMADGLFGGLNVHKADPDFYAFTVAPGATVDVTVLHNVAAADVDAFLYTSANCNDGAGDPGCANTLGCGYTSSNNEFVTWTNTTGLNVDCVLRISVWPSSAGDCADYDLILSGTGGAAIGSFCSPANPNSTGGPASMTGSFGGSGLHLESSGGPNGQFGYFLVSAGANAGVPVSQGLLCLASPQGRYNVSGTNRNSVGQYAGGTFVNLSGTSLSGTGFDVPATLPSPPGGAITPGSTWYFQLWYRDGVNSNFTNGLQVQF